MFSGKMPDGLEFNMGSTLTLPTQGGDSGTWGTEINTYIKGSGSTHLSETALDVTSTGQTTLYTVPSGFRLIIDKIIIISGATASPTAIVKFGQNGATDDFVDNQTLTNLAAQYDVVQIMPVPHATIPVKTKSYAAGTVIEADVTTADVDGGTDNRVILFGTLIA